MEDGVVNDERPDLIRLETQAEMQVVKNETNYSVQVMHKDQHIEANKYMSKKDIYEVFKMLTVNLVLKKPNDPIKSMIEQLKEIQTEEAAKSAETNQLETKSTQISTTCSKST